MDADGQLGQLGVFQGRLNAEQHLGLLRQLSGELAQSGNLQSVLRTIARSTMAALGYEDCVIYLVDQRIGDAGEVLVQRAAHGPKSPDGQNILNPITLDFGQGIVGACAASGLTVRVDDTSLDSRYIVDDSARGSELAVPIIDDGRVIGIIDSEHSEIDFYTRDDEQAVEDIAALAAARLRTAMTVEELERNVEQLQRARHELDVASRTDALTGLQNRRGFEESLKTFDLEPPAIAVAALVDVDRFKVVNDSHGHHCGDFVLRKLGRLFATFSEAQEVVAARLGGDEFVLLGRRPAQLQTAMEEFVELVRSQEWIFNGAVLDITISAGVATADIKQVWALADEALYLAKSGGRDQVVLHDSHDPRVERLEADKRWADEVHRGMTDDSLLLFAQPITRTTDPFGAPAYYEVLLRRRASDGTPTSPARMLAAAERFGLSERLDTWVLTTALQWLGSEEPRISLAINLGAPFVGSERAVLHLEQLMTRTGVTPEQLCLEITETMAIEDLERTKAFVQTVRQWGSKVAIDDFGSGWTTLPMVQELDVDVLKIDGSWISKSTTDELAMSVVSSTVEAAQIIGVDVVAEWVEDQTTLDFLTDLGVDLLQGYLTGRPRPLEDLRP